MTEQEIADWEREIQHAEMMKKNSKGRDGNEKNSPKVYFASARTAPWTYATSHSDALNEE